jgi:hypothetical protein
LQKIKKEYQMKFKFLCTALTGLILSTSCLVSTAHAGLIHSYDFSGSANDTTGSANGSVYGATLTTDRHGNSNSAYAFDGNNAIVANFSSPATATFAMWATWNGTHNEMLFNSGPNGQGVDLFFWKNIISWNSKNNSFGNISSTNIGDGKFHHYAVVNDAVNTLTTLYIDGTFFGRASYQYSNNSSFTIGAALRNGNRGWSGKIDDVQIFDTALDAAGVKALTSVPEPSTLAIFALSVPEPSTLAIFALSVPEPSTLAIFALGMIGLASRRFKKQP